MKESKHMDTVGKLIQVTLIAGAIAYFIPYLIAGIRETIQELKENKR
jgi:hypothetical protein